MRARTLASTFTILLVVASIVCAVMVGVFRPLGTTENVDQFWTVLVCAWSLTALAQVLLLVARAVLKLGDFTLLGVNLLLGGATAMMTIALGSRLDGTEPAVGAAGSWMVLLIVQLVSSTSAITRPALRS